MRSWTDSFTKICRGVPATIDRGSIKLIGRDATEVGLDADDTLPDDAASGFVLVNPEFAKVESVFALSPEEGSEFDGRAGFRRICTTTSSRETVGVDSTVAGCAGDMDDVAGCVVVTDDTGC